MKRITINIGGEERRIKFNIAAIQELESLLDGKNVMALFDGKTWSVTDIVSACYCGLKAYDRTITRQRVIEWVDEYAGKNEQGVYGLQVYLIAALGTSGLMGNQKSAFEEILNTLDNEKADGDEGK